MTKQLISKYLKNKDTIQVDHLSNKQQFDKLLHLKKPSLMKFCNHQYEEDINKYNYFVYNKNYYYHQQKRKYSQGIIGLPSLNIKKNKQGTFNLQKISNAIIDTQIHQQKKYDNTSNKSINPEEIQNIIIKPIDSLKLRKKIQLKQTATTLQTTPRFHHHSFERSFIDKSQIIFKKQQSKEPEKYQESIAFWKTDSCYVRIVKINNNQDYFQQNQHSGLLKIYGKMRIKSTDFLITQNFKGMTLQNILHQYGPCSQKLIKKHMKTLMHGLSTLHSKGYIYNSLTPSHIFITINGDIAIDTAKSHSSGKLTHEDKKNYFYYISPQLLLYDQNGYKNDTWSLGCVLLSLILGTTIDSTIIIHPYNDNEHQLQRYSKIQTKKCQQIYRRLIKFKKDENQRSKSKNGTTNYNLCKSLRVKKINNKKSIELDISEQLFCLVKECLKLDERIQIRNLWYHPFFKD